MGLFRRKQETRADTVMDETNFDALLRGEISEKSISASDLMSIPSVSACVNRIADTVASLDVKLYKRNGDIVEEVEDKRTDLFNVSTGDTLSAFDLKKQMVVDMLLDKGGYAFVNQTYKGVSSINYVRPIDVSFWESSDKIYKDYQILVQGKRYEGWQFIKLLRNTVDGHKSKTLIEESELPLSVILSSQEFEKNIVKKGGNKKGFLEATSRLSNQAMTALKAAFKKFYANNSENVIILNDGMKFQESSNTLVEMQLNENKKTNNDDICKMFLVPPPIINGGAKEEDYKLYHEGCIIPILERFGDAINNTSLLLEEEKGTYFFAFDTSDLLKGDMKKRYEAYEIAVRNGWMQVDEVRKRERLESFDLEFIKLGLQDVLYYPKEQKIYTPNTNMITDVTSAPIQDGALKGGE